MKKEFIPFAKPIINAKEKASALKVLNGPTLTHGPKCREFEKQFASFHKDFNAVTLSNCTSAMFLALKALNIGRGDEVIVPAMTHIATAHCVKHAGAEVVFCDIDIKTGNIDESLIEKRITHKTKAIIVVHFVGLPANMEVISKIAKNNSLFIIEDCAGALGAKYDKQIVGTFSDAGCFSFYPTKHITTMEGGMLITKSKNFAKKIRKLSSFGYNKTLQERNIPGIYDIDLLGHNLRMNEVAAAIGIEQLKKLPNFLKLRKNYALIIKSKLQGNKGFSILPSNSSKAESSDFCVNVILDRKYVKFRNSLLLRLKEMNLGTSVHYPVCLPDSKFYKSKMKKLNKKPLKFPVARYFASSIISLPCGPHLNSKRATKVAEIFLKAFREIINEK